MKATLYNFSILFRASSLQNLGVYDFYSLLSISVEPSCWPCIWWSGTGGFEEQGKFIFCSPKLHAPILSSIHRILVLVFLSMLWVGILGLEFWIDRKSLSPGFALQTLLNNNNNKKIIIIIKTNRLEFCVHFNQTLRYICSNYYRNSSIVIMINSSYFSHSVDCMATWRINSLHSVDCMATWRMNSLHSVGCMATWRMNSLHSVDCMATWRMNSLHSVDCMVGWRMSSLHSVDCKDDWLKDELLTFRGLHG